MKKMLTHFSSDSIANILDKIKASIGDYPLLIKQICKQIKNYYASIPNNGINPKLIIGLSGGIDSTVVAYLAVKAVGPKNIITVNIPAYLNDPAIARANGISKNLGNIHYTIPINKIVKEEIKSINKVIGKKLKINSKKQNKKDRVRIGNFASRARIAILYDVSKALNGRILGTGNRTEFLQGYAAKWGTPTSFDYGILDELYKIDIYELAKVLKVPEEIINSKPSTGYYPKQTHEQELGATLKEQDAAVYLLFEKKMTPGEIVNRYRASKKFIKTMLLRYKRSEDKRMTRQSHVKIRNFLY